MNKVMMSVAAAAALALTVPAFAQQKAPEPAKEAAKAAPPIPKNTFYKGLGPSQYLAKAKLIGQNVYNKEGQKIGDIEDIILGKDNTIDGVVIGAGGFANVGDKKIGVRYGALKIETKDGKQTITLPGVTKEVIAALEPYADSKTVLQRAKDAAKKASDAAKAGLDKAKDAVKGSGTPAAAEKK